MAYTRLDKLRNRRTDPVIMAKMANFAMANEVYTRLPGEDSAVQYAIGSMQPIDSEYTGNTIEERKRVQERLAEGYVRAGLGIDFDYQGSVTNNTHIRAHSDVDLLTVEKRWVVIQPPNSAEPRYAGDPIADLREIRSNAVSILKAAYPAAQVDETGSKAVNISGGSLRRKIDVIASAWWQTVEYVQEKHKHWLGVYVLDNEKGERISNKPILHNKRIEDRDVLTNGGLRKVIRLLKSLKYDSDTKVDITSYDISGIAYNIFDDWLTYRADQDLLLLKHCQTYLPYLLGDKTNRESLEVPNKTRKVFGEDGATEAGLRQLSGEVDSLVYEIDQGLAKSFRKLGEARVIY